MNLKKVLALLLVLVLSITMVVGCGQKPAATEGGSTEEENGKIRIGVAISTFDDVWLTYMLDGMKKYEASLGDSNIEISYVDSKNDPNVQLGQLENFIAQGFDAVVINPVDTEASGPLTDLAKREGMPLISVNRPFQNQEDATSYVGSDSIIAGILQMEALGELMGGQGNIVILQGESSHEAARMRTEGVKQVIAEKYPDIKVIAEQTGKWQRSLGLDIMENWIQAGLEIHGVASNNDEMAIGAIMALEQAGKLDEVFVAGIDASPDALEFMKDDKLDITVFQDANGQGGGAMEAAVKIAKGESVEDVVWIDYQLVLPDQVDEYIAKWQ
ncbi:monosaccharide ABC transporter substrate-binding protein, CUT2 family [Anaerovirgula multivorans]|uniref:Monosaccharide ABC transporter substrate-binding protein, CUT2 family n=1 Tax=Anaerovirgula multivorans TaxID=312168 RepID=A0A239CZV9_9FIRM|nr:sugar ABC transporter substrate-binding protein [Anaerovirgula multivorans]SNS25161.1 monosaccharide ABC transporter substrate-binding protein, CUT2 family [Anaerovirgula multivorans]